MKSHWRKLAAILPSPLEKNIYRRYFLNEHSKWVAEGQQAPLSHLAKQELIKAQAAEHKLDTLIETGTYMGDMVFAMQDYFSRIFSIELSPHFYRKAKARFQANKKVEIFHGDSGSVLPTIVPSLDSPVLFWLDGHYSGGLTAKGDKECPIYNEMAAILNSPYQHILMIDDARLFVGQNDYPTLEELKSYTLRIRPGSSFYLSGDVIIIKLK